MDDLRMAPAGVETLRRAKLRLEHPGFTIRALNALGYPIEKGFGYLPAGWKDKVAVATRNWRTATSPSAG